MALLAADLCGGHSSLVDDRSNIGIPPRTYRAHRDICSPVGFFLDQRHLGAFAVGLSFLTCFASPIFPVVRVHLALLARVVEELNGRQTGGVPRMLLFHEEAIPVHRETVAFDSSAAVHLAASVLPCEQIQQVFQAAPLVGALSQCLLLAISGVSLRLPMGWNSAGHSAVVMLLPSPPQPPFVAGEYQTVGLSSLAFAFLSPAAAKGQFVRCHYVLISSYSSPPAWPP